jgi:hypothetical protein
MSESNKRLKVACWRCPNRQPPLFALPADGELYLRSCFKIPKLALYGVKNWLKMLIYFRVNGVFSPLYALSRTHLRNFKTATKIGTIPQDRDATVLTPQMVALSGLTPPAAYRAIQP